MLGKFLEKASYIKAKITKDELEIALAEATTQDNWQASTSVLHEIASSAYDHEKWKRIREFLDDRLKNNKNWKKILKCLNIVEFLLKNGPSFVCNEFRYQLRFFKTLQSFQEYEGTFDRGASIRERAKSVVELLQNEEMLEDERLRAHQIRQKMSHITGGAAPREDRPQSNVPKYQSYSSETYSSAQDNKGYYNYGKGNYGDRIEDKKYDHDYFEDANRFKKTEEKPRSAGQIPDNQPPPEIVNPLPVKPQIVKATNNFTTSSPNKPKFSSITQSLMKKNNKPREKVTVNREEIVKPDLSYKKKDQEQLIDLEEAFMENRYHFQQSPTTPTPPQPVIHTQPPPIPAPVHVSKPVKPTMMSELDSISFLGGQTTTQNENPAKNPQSTVPPPPTQTVNNIQPIPQSHQPSSVPPPLTHPTPVHHPYNQPPSAPIGFLPPVPAIPSPYPVNYSPSNPYGPSAAYNQFNTYNTYGTSYYHPPTPNYYSPPTVNAPNYPYQPNYSQPPVYPAPHSPTIPYNPYANVPSNTNQIGLSNDPSLSLKPNPQEKLLVNETKKTPSTSNTMGNLMDLSDIMQDIEQTKKSPKKPQTNDDDFTNGVKIDKWAW